MKKSKSTNILIRWLLTSPILIISCDDNEIEKQPIITSQDLAFEINENPQAGQVLAPIEATTDEGSVSYSMLSESVTGSFEVTTKGELKVKDASKFDFEKNPFLTCEVLLQNKGTKDTVFALVAIKNLTEFLNVENAEVLIPENTLDNTLLAELNNYIGSDGDTFTFEVIAESVSNAITVNAKGEVFVGEKSVYDYEINKEIQTGIKVKSGAIEKTLTLTINVTNVFDSEVYPIKDFVKAQNPTFSFFNNAFANFNIGYTFKPKEDNVYVDALGCSPTKDGDYVVTLYDVSSKQVLTSVVVDVQNASAKNPSFFYSKTPQKIALVKDKEYAIAYYQKVGANFLLFPTSVLSSANSMNPILILKGVYAIGDSYPNLSDDNNPIYAVDMLLIPN
jgi:hypothetical protein